MRLKCAASIVLSLLCSILPAQEELAGSWKGDKALGDVYLEADGTGSITFLHDPQLTMRVVVEPAGDDYVVSQAEPNRDAFYTGVFALPIARVLTDQARPMVWRFTLTGDGERLVGTKFTTFVEYSRGPQPEVLSVDNEYERPAEWTRLSGRVIAPSMLPDPATADLPVTVSLDTPTPSARILYTLNGEPPTRESGTVYRGPFRVEETTAVRAIAVRDGWQDSALTEEVYLEEVEQGDGLSIRTPRIITVGPRQEWYHINDTNYTAMYYSAAVRANTAYELRIWDEADESDRYVSEFTLVEIYRDQNKDGEQAFQTREHNRYEFFSTAAGPVYIEVKNRYYQGFGEFAMRLREKP